MNIAIIAILFGSWIVVVLDIFSQKDDNRTPFQKGFFSSANWAFCTALTVANLLAA